MCRPGGRKLCRLILQPLAVQLQRSLPFNMTLQAPPFTGWALNSVLIFLVHKAKQSFCLPDRCICF